MVSQQVVGDVQENPVAVAAPYLHRVPPDDGELRENWLPLVCYAVRIAAPGQTDDFLPEFALTALSISFNKS